jgi:hypothetical protein
MFVLRQLRRDSEGTITFILEDQVFEEASGSMRKQRLHEITLTEETWRALHRALPQMLATPQLLNINF